MQTMENILFITGIAFVIGYKINIQKHEMIITVKHKRDTKYMTGIKTLFWPTAKIIIDTNNQTFFNIPTFPLKSSKKTKFIDAQLQVGKTYKIEVRGNKWGLFNPNIYKATEITK